MNTTTTVNITTRERWGATGGLVAVAAGAAAAVFERGGVSPDAPAGQITAFFAANGSAMLAQSALFVIGAAALLWFLAGLRAFLAAAEGGSQRLSTLAFGAGVAQVTINLVAQAFQVGLATAPPEQVSAGLVALTNAVFTLANVPVAVMLAAVAAVSLRHGAFPPWLGWLGAAAAVAHALLSVSAFAYNGPLAPGGALSYLLYPALVVWLVPAAITMIVRGGPAAREDRA
ncbi:hypothetical protein ACFFMN_39185 [Planobispora siamensis]|uniref:DUF4386 domain-containing protein n=1 Tax=Planobispora siamensis TaxID=936338 RepID=A0A8J3SVH6_9ACTN|nr:hypothetical protein [Planobispora siamensis]GIH96313.1 hypothetical protein Psi01_69430 [Planobispora siamensis]